VVSDFRVIPVLDVRNGQAVHAVGGIRSHYRPLRSILHASAEPLALARAFRDVLGFRDLYLADLDAISGSPPDLKLYRGLEELQLGLWIDAGLRSADDLDALSRLKQTTIVVGLETAAGPDMVRAILDRAEPHRVVLSLDLFDRAPRVLASSSWSSTDPFELACHIVDLGVRRLLLLDLSRVGTGLGTGTEELLARLRRESPDAQVSVGGGISGINEVLALRRAGAAAVLVGSALHDGRIGREDLA
jgi:phosphoribosylformimino-5-aminoimidazole carboxamide ribotide isomerase